MIGKKILSFYLWDDSFLLNLFQMNEIWKMLNKIPCMEITFSVEKKFSV